jgi:hypothetical protein
MGLWVFHFWGIYPNSVTLEYHISYLKNIHLQIVGIQTQNTIKIQNNLVIDMCACYVIVCMTLLISIMLTIDLVIHNIISFISHMANDAIKIGISYLLMVKILTIIVISRNFVSLEILVGNIIHYEKIWLISHVL